MTQALRYAGIFAVATMLATGFGTNALRAQGAGTSSTEADAKKKADAAKAAAAKQAAEKPQKPAAPTSSRPDPTWY